MTASFISGRSDRRAKSQEVPDLFGCATSLKDRLRGISVGLYRTELRTRGRRTINIQFAGFIPFQVRRPLECFFCRMLVPAELLEDKVVRYGGSGNFNGSHRSGIGTRTRPIERDKSRTRSVSSPSDAMGIGALARGWKESEASLSTHPPVFLDGPAAEMGALMQAHDWSFSTLGPPGTWPQALRTWSYV